MSGGPDSLVTLALAQRCKFNPGSVFAVFFDYGQPAVEQEREAARTGCARAAVPLLEWSVALPSLGAMADTAGAAGPRVVPWRNLVLLALAANYATSRGAGEVWYGACRDDRDEYPDCRPDFVYQLSSALTTLDPRNRARTVPGVQFVGPLLHIGKAEIGAMAREYGIGPSWSCYTPRDGEPCGTCNSCAARALMDAP